MVSFLRNSCIIVIFLCCRTKDRFNSTWEGLGTIRFADGSVYQGQTKNGTFNGKGRIKHANGDIYQGDWKNGKPHGYGVYVDT